MASILFCNVGIVHGILKDDKEDKIKISSSDYEDIQDTFTSSCSWRHKSYRSKEFINESPYISSNVNVEIISRAVDFSDIIEPDENLLNFIASEMKINIRETIGALNRIISFSRIYNKSPSVSESKIILKDLINNSQNYVTIENIIKTVCDYFKINVREMLSQRRSRYLVRPRQIAMYLTKNLTSKSLPDIGREFAGRDHTTVIHSVKTIDKLRGRDEEMSKAIEKLKNKILYKNYDEV